ncbi:unnamed protein product [Dicrocoelium dendriticum]|nr:unnamed protein product [Dicrocoelium dendriticum]
MLSPPQSAGKPADVICLCVGGRLFVTRRATLYRLPDSRLYLIATQGSSCPSPTNYGSFSSYAKSCSPSPNPFQNTYSTERAVVGGATLLPENISVMLAGNMNLKSASTLCRNRASVVPGLSLQPPSPSGKDCNCSTTLSTPGTPQLLGSTATIANYAPPVPPIVYFYDRDPEIFRFVLDYYRTGELHLPSSICGPFVRKELIFWGIDESLIGPCCMPAYMRYDEEKRTKNTLFRDCFEDIDSMQNLVKYSRGWKKWRYQMWLFMDHPSSSLPAKIWASCLLVLMIASVMCYCLSTHEVFRMPSAVSLENNTFGQRSSSFTRNNLATSLTTLQQYPTAQIVHPGDLQMSNNANNISLLPTILELKRVGSNYSALENESSPLANICDVPVSEMNPKLLRDCSTEPTKGLLLADMTLNCLFTAEFMLKVLLAPDKPKFLSSIVSLLDIIILSSYWVYMALFHYNYYYPKLGIRNNTELRNQLSGQLWLMNILSMTQAMRILRIFKISKISRILRVLILTVKKSIPELVLLGFLLMNGMFLFSSLMYMAEYRVGDTFPNIPQSFWWSIITLTAVGYGDMHPKGGAGYFVGSLTAICGCIVTGLAIPIIGNNFNTYYKYMKNQLMEDKYLATLRKDMGSTGQPCTKSGIGSAAEKSGLPLPGRASRQRNRRTVREHAAQRGWRQKFNRLLHLHNVRLPIRKGIMLSTRDRSKLDRLSENAVKDNKRVSVDWQPAFPNKVRLSTKLQDEVNADGELCPSAKPPVVTVSGQLSVDACDREQRPSLVDLSEASNPHLSTLLHLDTPQVRIDAEEREKSMSNGDYICMVEGQHGMKEGYQNEVEQEATAQQTYPALAESMIRPRNSYQEIDFIPGTDTGLNTIKQMRYRHRFSIKHLHLPNPDVSTGNKVNKFSQNSSLAVQPKKRKNYV